MAVALAVVVAAAALLIARTRLGLPSAGSEVPTGPLRGQTVGDALSITGIPVAVGRTVSLGVSVPVPADPGSTITLDGVELLEPTPGLRLADARASTGRGDSFTCIGSAREYPPAGCRVWPVEGWTIDDEALDHGTFQIVLGLVVDSPGVYGYPGVVVDYHDAEGAYRATFLQGGQVWAPRSIQQTGCPGTHRLRERQRQLLEAL